MADDEFVKKITESFESKKRFEEEQAKKKAEKKAKQKKTNQIILYTFLGLGGISIVIAIAVVASQQSTSYGCISNGNTNACIAGQGTLSLSECQKICANQLYECGDNGCVPSDIGTTLDECNKTCAPVFLMYTENNVTGKRQNIGDLFDCETDNGTLPLVTTGRQSLVSFVDSAETTRIYSLNGYYLRMYSSMSTWYVGGTTDLKDASYFLIRQRTDKRYEIQGYVSKYDHIYIKPGDACGFPALVGTQTLPENDYFVIEKQ